MKSASERVSEREGFQRFLEVFRGSQRFLEVFRDRCPSQRLSFLWPLLVLPLKLSPRHVGLLEAGFFARFSAIVSFSGEAAAAGSAWPECPHGHEGANAHFHKIHNHP